MYSYEEERPNIFTEEGQRKFLKVRDHVAKCLRMSGAVRMAEAIQPLTGSSWEMLACVDLLVELGELREITSGVAQQHRVFVSK